MKNSAFENFSEEALEVLDFARCQRPDGSFYGTGGTCRKGFPTGAKEKEVKSARKSAKASGEVADRKAAARKENEAKKAASPRTDSKMSSASAAEVKAKFDLKNKQTKVKALDKEAKAADKAGRQDGPTASTKQRIAAVKVLTREKNLLQNKQDDGEKLSKVEESKLKRIEASLRAYQ